MRAGIAVVTALLAVPCAAAALGPVTIDGSATAVSDYRFRGGSLSGRDPAVTASLDAALPAGVFAGVFAASRGRYRGGDAEIDAYGGWSGGVGPFTASAGGYFYAYPAGGGSFGEAFASVARTLGPVSLTLGINYAPSQRAIGHDDNFYGYALASAGVPGTPFTLRASVGRESGGRVRVTGGGGTKIDYMIGAEAKLLRVVTLGVRYVGNNVRDGGNFRNAVVVSAGVGF